MLSLAMYVKREPAQIDHVLEYVGPTLAEHAPNWSTCGDARVAALLSGLVDIATTKPPLPTPSGPPKVYCPRSLDPDSNAAAAAATSTAAASSSDNFRCCSDNFDVPSAVDRFNEVPTFQDEPPRQRRRRRCRSFVNAGEFFAATCSPDADLIQF